MQHVLPFQRVRSNSHASGYGMGGSAKSSGKVSCSLFLFICCDIEGNRLANDG